MNKTIIVLDALLKGHRIKVEDTIYCLSEDKSLCVAIEAQQYHKEFLMRVNLGIELKTFIDFCEKISDEDMAQIIFNKVIKNLHE